MMISQFTLSNDEKRVSWTNNGLPITLAYERPVAANHIAYLDQVIVQADAREHGPNNLFIYNADGSLNARPDMPTLKRPVQGVYAVWFVPNQRYVTVILLTDEYSPYDTACTFDLEKHTFTKFHPSR